MVSALLRKHRSSHYSNYRLILLIVNALIRMRISLLFTTSFGNLHGSMTLIVPVCGQINSRPYSNLRPCGSMLLRGQTKLLLFVSLCVVGVIFIVPYMSKTPALPRHNLKENGSTQETNNMFTASGSMNRPYMLVLRYSDQITAGSVNLRSLMCLAKKIGGVQVVEPFVTGSSLGLNFRGNWTKEVRMSDIFDFKAWKHATSLKKYGELVSFKEFLQNCPRKLLMVQHCFHASSTCHPCKHEDVVLKSREFCKLNNFELVGHECFSEKTVNLSSIKSLLYSKYKKSEVVVMFDVFGGIETSTYKPRLAYRFFANVPECSRKSSINRASLKPSQSVLSDADKYIQTYLNDTSYIAVMIRLEIVFIKAKTSRRNRPTFAKECFTNVLQSLEKIKKELGLNHVFVTLDIGQYGSGYFRGEKNLDLSIPIEHHAEDFLSTIYGRNMTIGEYEERHIRTSRKIHPGYISVVQKQIAARADALVLVGKGSSYQSTTKDLYNALRKNKPKHVFSLYSKECK